MKNKERLMLALKNMIIEGGSDTLLQDHIKKHYKTLAKKEQPLALIAQARDLLSKEHSSDPNDVIVLHSGRYTSIINELMRAEELDCSLIGKQIAYEDWWQSRHNKIRCYLDTLDTMAQYEHLMRLTEERSVSLIINQNLTINNTGRKREWDVELLSMEELIDFYELMMKIKITGFDAPVGVSQSHVALSQSIATPLALLQEPLNIELIKHEKKVAPTVPTPSLSSTDRLRQNLTKIASMQRNN